MAELGYVAFALDYHGGGRGHSGDTGSAERGPAWNPLTAFCLTQMVINNVRFRHTGAMVGERWRPAVLVLAGTVWIWALVMPRLRAIILNPAIHPTSELLWIIPVMIVLLLIDIGAIVYMLPRKTEESTGQDQDQR